MEKERLGAFPPRDAVRCSVSMATWLTRSPHDGAGLLLPCSTVNVWWFCKRGAGKTGEVGVRLCKVFPPYVLLWRHCCSFMNE